MENDGDVMTEFPPLSSQTHALGRCVFELGSCKMCKDDNAKSMFLSDISDPDSLNDDLIIMGSPSKKLCPQKMSSTGIFRNQNFSNFYASNNQKANLNAGCSLPTWKECCIQSVPSNCKISFNAETQAKLQDVTNGDIKCPNFFNRIVSFKGENIGNLPPIVKDKIQETMIACYEAETSSSSIEEITSFASTPKRDFAEEHFDTSIADLKTFKRTDLSPNFAQSNTVDQNSSDFFSDSNLNVDSSNHDSTAHQNVETDVKFPFPELESTAIPECLKIKAEVGSFTSSDDRVMPQLIPSSSNTVICIDEEELESFTSIVNHEVIDVASSPEMPTLIPFTFDSEENRIKTEHISDYDETSLSKDTLELHDNTEKFPQIMFHKLSLNNNSSMFKSKNAFKKSKIQDHSFTKNETNKSNRKPNDGPIMDKIDGLNFFSFKTKRAMEKHIKIHGKDLFERLEKDMMEVVDMEMIVPTKTTDITQIKGWQNKYFAPESHFQPWHLKCENQLDKPDNALEDFYSIKDHLKFSPTNSNDMSSNMSFPEENQFCCNPSQKTDKQLDLPNSPIRNFSRYSTSTETIGSSEKDESPQKNWLSKHNKSSEKNSPSENNESSGKNSPSENNESSEKNSPSENNESSEKGNPPERNEPPERNNPPDENNSSKNNDTHEENDPPQKKDSPQKSSSSENNESPRKAGSAKKSNFPQKRNELSDSDDASKKDIPQRKFFKKEKSSRESTPDKLDSKKLTKTANPHSAFISEALENFLENASELNVSFLQKVNPNITPVPRGASILALGNLRKCDNYSRASYMRRKRSFVYESKTDIVELNENKMEEGSSESSASTEEDVPVALLKNVKRKLADVPKAEKLPRKIRRSNSRTESQDSNSQRLVLRLKKEGLGHADGYKVADISSEKYEGDEESSSSSENDTCAIESFKSQNKGLSIIKQTIFAKKDEPEILDEFIHNLNMCGTRKDVTMLVQSNQSYFNSAPVIIKGVATKALGALLSNADFVDRKLKKNFKSKRATKSQKGKNVVQNYKVNNKDEIKDNSVVDRPRSKRNIKIPLHMQNDESYIDFVTSAVSRTPPKKSPNLKAAKIETTSPLSSETSSKVKTCSPSCARVAVYKKGAKQIPCKCTKHDDGNSLSEKVLEVVKHSNTNLIKSFMQLHNATEDLNVESVSEIKIKKEDPGDHESFSNFKQLLLSNKQIDSSKDTPLASTPESIKSNVDFKSDSINLQDTNANTNVNSSVKVCETGILTSVVSVNNTHNAPERNDNVKHSELIDTLNISDTSSNSSGSLDIKINETTSLSSVELPSSVSDTLQVSESKKINASSIPLNVSNLPPNKFFVLLPVHKSPPKTSSTVHILPKPVLSNVNPLIKGVYTDKKPSKQVYPSASADKNSEKLKIVQFANPNVTICSGFNQTPTPKYAISQVFSQPAQAKVPVTSSNVRLKPRILLNVAKKPIAPITTASSIPSLAGSAVGIINQPPENKSVSSEVAPGTQRFQVNALNFKMGERFVLYPPVIKNSEGASRAGIIWPQKSSSDGSMSTQVGSTSVAQPTITSQSSSLTSGSSSMTAISSSAESDKHSLLQTDSVDTSKLDQQQTSGDSTVITDASKQNHHNYSKKPDFQKRRRKIPRVKKDDQNKIKSEKNEQNESNDNHRDQMDDEIDVETVDDSCNDLIKNCSQFSDSSSSSSESSDSDDQSQSKERHDVKEIRRRSERDRRTQLNACFEYLRSTTKAFDTVTCLQDTLNMAVTIVNAERKREKVFRFAKKALQIRNMNLLKQSISLAESFPTPIECSLAKLQTIKVLALDWAESHPNQGNLLSALMTDPKRGKRKKAPTKISNKIGIVQLEQSSTSSDAIRKKTSLEGLKSSRTEGKTSSKIAIHNYYSVNKEPQERCPNVVMMCTEKPKEQSELKSMLLSPMKTTPSTSASLSDAQQSVFNGKQFIQRLRDSLKNSSRLSSQQNDENVTDEKSENSNSGIGASISRVVESDDLRDDPLVIDLSNDSLVDEKLLETEEKISSNLESVEMEEEGCKECAPKPMRQFPGLIPLYPSPSEDLTCCFDEPCDSTYRNPPMAHSSKVETIHKEEYVTTGRYSNSSSNIPSSEQSLVFSQTISYNTSVTNTVFTKDIGKRPPDLLSGEIVEQDCEKILSRSQRTRMPCDPVPENFAAIKNNLPAVTSDSGHSQHCFDYSKTQTAHTSSCTAVFSTNITKMGSTWVNEWSRAPENLPYYEENRIRDTIEANVPEICPPSAHTDKAINRLRRAPEEIIIDDGDDASSEMLCHAHYSDGAIGHDQSEDSMDALPLNLSVVRTSETWCTSSEQVLDQSETVKQSSMCSAPEEILIDDSDEEQTCDSEKPPEGKVAPLSSESHEPPSAMDSDSDDIIEIHSQNTQSSADS